MTDADWQRIDELLPQTQCGRCGFGGCEPYARALASGTSELNRCAPGGEALIATLAALLKRPALALADDCGPTPLPATAWVDPERCTGCARCLPACPVDAIVGAHRWLHTISETDCTGCALCVPSCPVDCIVMRPRTEPEPSPMHNRTRYGARTRRLHEQAVERSALLQARKQQAGA